MQRLLPAMIVLSATLVASAGCCRHCAQGPPVDLEDLGCALAPANGLKWHYPYSAPPCPYFDYRTGSWYGDQKAVSFRPRKPSESSSSTTSQDSDSGAELLPTPAE